MATELRRMFQLRGTASEWESSALILESGELGVELHPVRPRVKVGNGVDAWTSLPYLAEADPIARDAISALATDVVQVALRVSANEREVVKIAGLESNLLGMTQAINSRQPAFEPGAVPGDLIAWDGNAWVRIGLNPTNSAMLYYDAIARMWRTISPGLAGTVLTTSPNGSLAWQNAGSIAVRSTTLQAAGASIAAAFNNIAPTVGANELMVVSWNGSAYLYTGPPGINIVTATDEMFISMGASTPWAVSTDYDNAGTPNKAVDAAGLISVLVARYLSLAGGTLYGALKMEKSSIRGVTETKDRWALELGNTGTSPEAGGNVGSDLVISRFADDGTWLGTALKILRANGAVDFEQTPTVNGQPFTAGAAAPLPRMTEGVGQFVLTTSASGGNYTLPPGGTWLSWRQQYNMNGTYAFVHQLDIIPGGTAFGAAGASYAWVGWAWRIA